MDKRFLILTISALAFSTIAQETNEFKVVPQKGEPPVLKERKEARKADYQQRRLQLMERELKKIGVTDEQKARIVELQKTHKERMKLNTQQITMAKEKLSTLLNESAPMETIEAAIQEVSAAQTEQLRILVNNRIQLERILGREKHALFMQNARTQYQMHGRRGGPQLPPRPSLPPIPGQEHHRKEPPVPSHQPEVPPPPEKPLSESAEIL